MAATDVLGQARRAGRAWPLGGTLAKTVAHFFPELTAWLGDVRGTRDQDLTTYSRQFLIRMSSTSDSRIYLCISDDSRLS